MGALRCKVLRLAYVIIWSLPGVQLVLKALQQHDAYPVQTGQTRGLDQHIHPPSVERRVHQHVPHDWGVFARISQISGLHFRYLPRPISDNFTIIVLLAFVVWASSELNIFTTHFIKQVFLPQTSLPTLTECVILARTQCERVFICTINIPIGARLTVVLTLHL